MDLFNDHFTSANILPYDGIVAYYGKILAPDTAHGHFNALHNTIAWEQDQIMMFGKLITTKRKVGWYGDTDFKYTYSSTTKRALPWTPELLDLKYLIEAITEEHFNSCLLNLYHNGDEGMGWHSDNERELKPNGAIASISLGAERKFVFKHRITKETVSILLHDGSLLMMKGVTQTHWLHRLPPTKRILEPRINLTFRWIEG